MKKLSLKVMIMGLAAMLFPRLATAKESQLVSYTVQWQAYAPNAGGQQAYSLRRGTDTHEISIFRNEYLLAGGQPLLGATYDFRFPVCDSSCLVQAYLQAGAGLTTGGPIVEISWSMTGLWLARVDFTTHLFFTKRPRLISWSIPLWLGLSIPSPW